MTAAGDAKALGAATCWALEQFERDFAEESQDVSKEDSQALEANPWKLMPSVGTWLMSMPRSLAEVVAEVTSERACDVTVSAKGGASSSTTNATPRKARSSGVNAVKAKSSPKAEARRTPGKSPDRANRSPVLAKSVKSVQARAASPLAKPVEQAASETLTPSRKRESTGTKPRAASPKPQPKAAPVPPVAAVDATTSNDAPAAEPSQHATELHPSAPQLEEKEAAQPQTAPAHKPKCSAAVKPRSPSVPKDRPCAKSPTVAVSKAPTKSPPQQSTTSRAAQKTPVATKAKTLSSAEIEAQEIEERRKQAKLLAEKNARRMNRAPSSKQVAQTAGGQGSPAVAAPPSPSGTSGKNDKSAAPVANKAGASAGAQPARRPSPLRKTQAVPDKSKDTSAVAAATKAAVAATPRPVKNTVAAASPRLRRPSAPAEASKSTAAAAATGSKSSVSATVSRTKSPVSSAPQQTKPLQRPPSPATSQRAAKAAASPPLRKASPRNSVKVAAADGKASSVAAVDAKASSTTDLSSKESSSAIPAA